MKDFFKLKWVQITAWIFVEIGNVVLLLGGTSAGELAKVPALVFGIIEAIGLLVIFIKKMIQAKENASEKQRCCLIF